MLTSFKILVQRTQQQDDSTKPLGNAKFTKKNNVSQLSHGIKNIHRSKLHQLYTYLGNTFLQLLLLKVFEAFLLDRVKKLVAHFGRYESSLHF